MILVFDIETAPDESNSKLIELVLSSAKETSRTKLEDAQQKLRDEFAISAMTGKIVSIALGTEDDRVISFQGKEKDILQMFNSYVELPVDRYISFNGKRFDVRFLNIRAALYGIPIPHISMKRYETEYHLDLREYLSGSEEYAKGTLDQWAEFFGIESTCDVKGWMIPKLYETGQIELIKQHNEDDVRKMLEIYKRIKNGL